MTDITSGPLGQLFAQFSAFFPKAVGCVTVLLIGWLVSRTVRNVVRRVLSELGIDRLGKVLNEIDVIQNSGIQIEFSKILSSIIYYVMMLIFIIAATEALGVAAITQIVTDLLNYLPSALSAGVVLLFGIFLADMVKGAVHTVCKSIGIPSAGLISNVVFYFMFLTIAISALAQAKIDTGFISSSLTVIVGAVALAFSLGYGFATRDMMANYIAGQYNKNKVRLGDDVRIIGMRGKVVMLDATSMILQTHDRAILIPLSKLTTEKVEIFYPDPQDENLLEEGQGD
jgi:small-conductance mechanosensitive channel